jgi:rod shape-determining protein MreD
LVRTLLLAVIVYVAAVVETSLGDVMRVGRVTPDLLALVAVVYVLAARSPRAFLAAGAIALAGDLIAPGRLGVGAAWMLVVGYAVGRLRHHVRLDHFTAQVPVVGLAVACWATGVAATARLLGDLPLAWPAIAVRSAGVGLYTAGVAIPVLMVLGWTRERAVAPQRRASA